MIGDPSAPHPTTTPPAFRDGLEFRHRLVIGLNYNPWSSTNPCLTTDPSLNSGEWAHILYNYTILFNTILYIIFYIGVPSPLPFRSGLECRHRLAIGLNYNPRSSTNPCLSPGPGLNSGDWAYIIILYYII